MFSRVTQTVFGLAFAYACLSPLSAAAQQASSATVTGTVFDPTDAVVVGATVSLRNDDTNQVLHTTTNHEGRYRLLYVPVGAYRLSVDATGFVTTSVDLTLAVGQGVDVPLKLTSASAAETVSVVTTVPVVDAARTQVADVIRPQEIDALPLNGRNYLDLALLVPNVSRHNTRANERFAETSAVPGTGISIAGQRNLGNSFLVDGLSANDDAADLAGTYYGEEVIREFQVITAGGVAEFGRASAGTINIVTQSGTNQRRGRVYGFFRDAALDAPNALATTEDRLSQRQYGVSYGGPIRRDRTFWFANLERTEQAKTGFVTVPPANVTALNAALDRFQYPGPRVETGAFDTGYHTTNVFGRVDQAAGSSRMELRYSMYNVGSPNARGVGGLNAASRGTRLDNTDHTAAMSLQSIVGPTLINEIRAQYTSSRLSAPVNDPVGPAISVSGVANLGISSSSPTARNLNVLQLADTLTLQHEAHLVKAGMDVLFNHATITFPGATRGTYAFGSLADLQRGTYSQYQQAFGEADLSQANPNFGLFVQDEWRPIGSLTVNAGVRYDLQWLPSPIHLDANNVSPRLGVAWAPGGGQTVVRASGGVYFDRIPLRATSNALQRDGVRYKVAVLSSSQPGAPAFPDVLPVFPEELLTAVTSIDPHIQNGRSEQFALQVERGFGRRMSATIGYTRLRGHQIIMSRNINVPTLTAAQAAALGVPNLGRPDPNFGNISQYQSIGDSWFNGLTLSLGTRNLSWGSTRVSYTLSKALDDSGNAFFNSASNSFDILADKGPSDNDQRHRVTVSGTIGGGDAHRALSRAMAGLQVGYFVTLATGQPFNVLSPFDLNNDTNFNDRPVGYGRNSERLPGSSSVDVRVSRVVSMGSHGRLEIMVEAFNVFNHVNVLNVNSSFGTGSAPAPTLGQPSLVGDPRQIQLGVRWSF